MPVLSISLILVLSLPRAVLLPGDYDHLLELAKAAQSPSGQVDRHEQAMAVGRRMAACYAGLSDLSFVVKTTHFVIDESSRKSNQPLGKWERQNERITASVRSQAGRVASSVDVKGQPLWRFYLNDGVLAQFKFPWNGVEGQRASMRSDLTHVQLRRGVESDLICDIPKVFQPWVGPRAHKPQRYLKMFIDRGALGAGGIKLNDEIADLIILPDPENTQWDAFYVNKRGFLVRRITIVVDPPPSRRRLLIVDEFSEFDTSPIPKEAFAPPSELLRVSANWRHFSESEAIAERLRAVSANNEKEIRK